LERLEQANQLGGKLIRKEEEYREVCIIPLNRLTANLYNKIDDKNREVWKDETPNKI